MKINLTEVQKAYLLGRNDSFDGNIGTHMYAELNFSGDIKKFETAFNRVVELQPMLRAKIYDVEKFEIVDKYEHILNIHKETEEMYERKKNKIRAEFSHKNYSSSDFPFYNIQALTKDKDKYIIFVSIDLLIADGLSLFKLLEQIKGEYLNLTKLEEDKIDDLLYINKKYSEEKLSERYKKSKEHWLNKIKTLPEYPHIKILENKIKTSKFERKEYIFTNEELSYMEKISKEKGISLNSVLFTLYAATLQKWSENKEFTINMTTFKRPRKSQYLDVIGDFTSTMLVDVNIDKSKMLSENAIEINKKILSGLRYSSFEGVEVLREISKRENKIAIMPYVFTSMLFEMENFGDFINFDYWISQTPQVYIDCQIKKMNGILHISWDYLKDIFEGRQIDEIFNHFIRHLKEFINNSEECLININAQDENEIKAIYNQYNSHKNIITNCTENIISAFKKILYMHGDKVAFLDKDKEITFKDLDILSETNRCKIEKFKQENNLKKIRVGIEGDKNINSMIQMLSVIKTGDSFCFISKEMPEERKTQLEKVSNFNIYIKDGELITNHTENIDIPENELYIIFTSGTTGIPKGISINEHAALNTIDDIIERFKLSHKDCLFNISELSFDLSIFDIITPLIIGATTILCKNIYDIQYFSEYLECITLWNSTPGLMQAIMNSSYEQLNNIKYVMMSGDFISNSLVKDIKEKIGKNGVEIYSLGGATEASIWSIYYSLKEITDERIPYGYPLSNQKLYILDNKDKLLPAFVEGEIIISGCGLANGYLNEEENEHVFYNHKSIGKVYRTGDKGYYNSDGHINIVGRIKSELKVNGYRVDLIEIEKCLNKIHHIKMSKVIIKNNKQNKAQIVAFYTSIDGKDITSKYLRETLKNYLSQYMIPTRYIFLNNMPLTQNGKIDSIKLLEISEIETQVDILTKEEFKMAKIWVNVIKEDIDVNKINPNESFFDIGGDSILLTELIHIIGNEYNIELSIEELLNNFTLKELTGFIEGKSRYKNSVVSRNKNIIKLSNGDKNKNIVFIHAGSGEIAIYNNLAKLICPHYNIYAIKYPKDINKVDLREIDFAEIANEYSELLKEIGQIDLIGGWCIGGTIGFEIAKINNCVSKVILINSLAPVEVEKELFGMDLENELNFINEFINLNFESIKNTQELWNKIIEVSEENPIIMSKLMQAIPKNLSRLIPFFGDNSARELIYYVNLFRSFERARYLYKSEEKINQPIIYIGAKQEVIGNYSMWQKYTYSNFIEEHVSGNHTTIFSRENMGDLAKMINKQLI